MGHADVRDLAEIQSPGRLCGINSGFEMAAPTMLTIFET